MISRKPNFIILQADDLGWDDLPLNGNIYVETPGIDKLAKESVQINRFYVNPVCAPTRAALLTGRDFLLTGVSHVHGGKDFLNLNEKTFADIFGAEGYRTGIWGKWHSGKTEGYYPWQRGFDEAYMADLYRHENSSGFLNGKRVEHEKWTDEVIVDYAIDFINRNKYYPFIAYLSFLTCHAPLAARDEIIEKYKSKGLSENLSTLYAMIEQMDNEILRLLHDLEKNNLKNNTVIIFISDNGPAVINNWLNDTDRKIRYGSGFKGHKGNIWENGVKSPLLIAYPEKLLPVKRDLLSDVTDIFPTMAEFAGIKLDQYNLELTGRSFAGNLLNEDSERRKKYVFNYADKGWPPTSKAWTPKGVKNEYLPVIDKNKELLFDDQIISITSGSYKLLKNPSFRENDIIDVNGYVLVDLINDMYEEKNIVDSKSEVFIEMDSILKEKFDSILNFENSFKNPIFNLGKGKENRILLYAPAEFQGELNIGYNFSYPWNSENLSAQYEILAVTDLQVHPVILKSGDTEGNEYLISINERESYSLYNEDSQIHFSSIPISKGRHNLKLSVKSAKNKDEIIFKELILKEDE